MPISIVTTIVTEKGTADFTVSFTDTSGAAVTPNDDITWTLTDPYGAVVNSRSAVSGGTPSTSITIVLSGNDLALSSSYNGRWRVLTVQCTYNSTIGSDLPLKQECWFYVGNLVAVS